LDYAETLKHLISRLSEYYKACEIPLLLIIDKANRIYNGNCFDKTRIPLELIDAAYFDLVILCASNNNRIYYSKDIQNKDIEADFVSKAPYTNCFVYRTPFNEIEASQYLIDNLSDGAFLKLYSEKNSKEENREKTLAQTNMIPLELCRFCEVANASSSNNNLINFDKFLASYEREAMNIIRTDYDQFPQFDESIVRCFLKIPMITRPKIDKRIFYYTKKQALDLKTSYQVYAVNNVVFGVLLEKFSSLNDAKDVELSHNEKKLRDIYKELLQNTSNYSDQVTSGKALEAL